MRALLVVVSLLVFSGASADPTSRLALTGGRRANFGAVGQLWSGGWVRGVEAGYQPKWIGIAWALLWTTLQNAIAGAERIFGFLDEPMEITDAAGEVVTFVDELHTIVGAGAAEGAMDAGNMIKPMLARGELKMIGATTLDEYRKHIEKDPALERRFQQVYVGEPSVEDTIGILRGLKERYEVHHGVRIQDSALVSAAVLSNRYLTNRFLPDKAIDVIDEAGANLRLRPESEREEVVTVTMVENIVAKMARIPPKSVSSSDKDVLRNLERNLKLTIFGQDPAIAALSSAIKMSRSGLTDEEKPIGSFLFAGPTGVGKTEVTRQLALIMGVELIRFDMSEYMERHTVSRLIGAPPGYVGFDQGGLLTEAVLKHPHAVVLLDEIEKAHPEVFNLLLQVMDHGTLTDNNGREADFRNIVLVMTTNAGAQEMSRASIGFTHQDHSSDGMTIIKKSFTPEFRNRLDAIIQFSPLDGRSIARVVDKLVVELEAKLGSSNVTLELTNEARAWIAERGYDPQMGARPMARIIQEQIKRPLAEELLFGKLVHGGEVSVHMKDGVLGFEIVAAAPKKGRKGGKAKVKAGA